MTSVTKPAIIIIHGLRGNHFGVQKVADILSEKYGYQVFAPDLPGSGTCPELKNKTLDGYSAWFVKYIKKLNLDRPPIIVGHSMGSIIVSYFINQHPELVDNRVILVSPIFRSKIGRVISSAEYYAMFGLLHLLPKKPRYYFMRSKLVSFVISHVLTYDKSMQKQIDLLHYRYCLFASADALLADCKISMKNEALLLPDKKVLYCIGDHDQLTSLKNFNNRLEGTPYARKVVKGTGHLINYERPKTLARIINDFAKD